MKRARTILQHWTLASTLAANLAAPAALAVDSTGLPPITDMAAGDTYEGYPAGLYPGGLNHLIGQPLARRLQAGLRIIPRNADGLPAQDGHIVLLSIGMSNTAQEFTAFQSVVTGFAERNPALTIVNGAQGGQTADDIDDPNAPFWTIVDDRLATAGVSPLQVQAVWLKEANRQPTGPVVDEIVRLRGQLVTIAQIIRQRYPRTQLIYAGSRTYGGYAVTALNPEPYAHGSGFAVQSVIADQITGADPGLQAGPGGVVPEIQWGPYLWADGVAGRDDGLVWLRDDFAADGVHPSASGRAKVADLLLEHFANDWSARIWFLRPQLQVLIGDFNRDRSVTPTDIAPFVLSLTDPGAFAAAFPGVDPIETGDLNADGELSVADIGPFVRLITSF